MRDDNQISALADVIEEKQREIERLERALDAQRKALERRQQTKEDLIAAAVAVFRWPRLRECWREDADSAWKEYHELLHELRMAAIEAGWCFRCGSVNCMGDCRDEDW